MVKVAILNGLGINADQELARAFNLAGAHSQKLHLGELKTLAKSLDDYQILALPGGFSFGDHLGCGLVMAAVLRQHLLEPLNAFLAKGGLILGVCNGFQILLKLGLLPNPACRTKPEFTLIHNQSGCFENSWLTVEFNQNSPCLWTKNLTTMEMPIRHGEGRFYAPNLKALNQIEELNLVALRYSRRNPNGSQNNIAGLTDQSGQIFGLMPHPEAFLIPENHPRWTRKKPSSTALAIFANAVRHAGGC